MTVSSSTRSAGPFAGNGVTTAFPFTFKVFAKTDLELTKTVTATGAQSVLVLDSDYSVTLNADQDANPGGTITYPAVGSPLPAGQTLAAEGSLPALQETDIGNTGRFLANVVENALDYLTILAQQLVVKVGRAVSVPVGETVAAVPSAGVRAGKVFTWDDDGDPAVSEDNFAALAAAAAASESAAAVSAAGSANSERQAAAIVLGNFLQDGVGAEPRTFSSKNRDIVDLRDFTGGTINEANDYTTELNNAVAQAAGMVLRLPPKTIRTQGISAAMIPLFVGEGPRFTKLVHIDGSATPLIHVTGGDTGVAAYPYDGFSDMALEMGSLTTGLIYFDGRIDNQVIFENLAFRGATGPASSPGLTMRDYVNLRMSRIRWDGVGGYGVEVRDADVFPNASLSIVESTYDNEAAGQSAWGAGLLSIDCSGLTTGQSKGVVSIGDFKAEIHKQLTTAKPARGFIRIVQNAGVNSAQLHLALRDFEFGTGATAPATKANVQDMRLVSVNAKDIMLGLDNVKVFGIAEIYNNDAGTAKDAIYCQPDTFSKFGQSIPRENQNAIPTISNQDKVVGIRTTITDSDANRNSGVYGLGDVAANEKPLNTAGRLGRAFAYKAVQAQAGVCAQTPGAIAVTGSATNGLPTLTLSGNVPTSIFRGACLSVAGAFTNVRVLDVDYTANTCTMESNATGTVAGAAITQSQAALMAVEMVWYVSAVPTSTAIQYRARDRAINLAAGDAYPVQEWICTVSSTLGTNAGTWRATKWHVVKDVTGNRPALTASDVGVMYLDETLDADGKPIWWTGTAWVDAVGAVV